MPQFPGISALLAAALLLTGSYASASDIYKWTDAQGNVHYGDRPAEDVESERMDIQSRRTDPTRVAALAQARAESRSTARQQSSTADTAGDEMSPEEKRAAEEERIGQCNTYKERLQLFVQSRRLYREDENGERVYLSEQEMQSARENVESKVEEYCNS